MIFSYKLRRPLGGIVILCTLLWTSGCANTGRTVAPTTAEAPNISNSLVTENERPTSNLQQVDDGHQYTSYALNRFAYHIIKLMKQKQVNELVALFDTVAYKQKTISTPGLTPFQKTVLLSQLKEPQTLITPLVQVMYSMYADDVHLSLVAINPVEHYFVVRLQSGDLLDFLEFNFEEKLPGEFSLVDIREHLSAYSFASSIAKVFQLLVDVHFADGKEVSDRLKKYLEYLRNGQIDEVRQLAGSLPKSVTDKEIFQYLSVLHLAKTEVTPDIAAMFEAFHQQYPDREGYQLLYAFYWLGEEDFARSLQHLERIPEILRSDAALLSLQCLLQRENKLLEQAASSCLAAIRQEPLYELSYFNLAQLFLDSNQPEAAFETFKILRDKFNYEFNPHYFSAHEDYAVLLRLPGFEEWLNQPSKG